MLVSEEQNKEVQFLRVAAPLSGENKDVLTHSWLTASIQMAIGGS